MKVQRSSSFRTPEPGPARGRAANHRLGRSVADPLGAMDIGGTHATAAVVDFIAWTVQDSAVRIALDSNASAADIIDRFLQAAAAVEVAPDTWWGVSIPDPFDYRRGIAHYQGVGKFDRLRGMDIRSALSTAIGSRPAGISFVNDADAFLLGEWLRGAATGTARSAAVTLGTGVGSSFLADGFIVDSGPDVPPGGRAHRLRVDGQPLEELMSRRAIRRAYAAVAGDMTADVREICRRARDGDALAQSALSPPLRTLGSALGPWLHRFGAQMLVVGGSMAASWDVLQPAFLQGLTESTSQLRIRVAADADRAPLLGAAWTALRTRQQSA